MYRSYSYRFGNFMYTKTAIIISLVFVLFELASLWRLFTKAGQGGWKCLIPIYNAYIVWDIAWEGSRFWLLFLGGPGISLVTGLLARAGQFGLIISGLLELAWGIYAIVLSVQMAIRLAHRFGKSTAFGVVGLWLFGGIGIPILAWGSADYNADRDLGDGVLRSDAELAQDAAEKSDYWNRISGS